MRRCYLAAAALVGLFVIAGSIEAADATNIDVSVSSACVGTTWQVTLNAHNTHTAALHVVNDNNVENYSAFLAPGEAQHVRIEPPDGTFSYVWSSPDAHLVGVLSGTLHRPEGCAPPPTTTATTVPTTEAPPSTTTPTTGPTAPPTSAPPASLDSTPGVTAVIGGSPSTSAASPSRPPSSTPTNRINLPVTGSNATLGAVVGSGFALVGIALVVAVRRRAS